MNVDFEEIEELELQREEQVEWWSENGAELGAEEKDELFDWIIDQGKFHYLELLIELTLDNLDDPPTFSEDLRRIVPQIDNDLAWSQLYDEYRERLVDEDISAENIFYELQDADEEWLAWMGGVALGKLPERDMRDEIIDLLESREIEDVQAGIQSAMEQYQGGDLPDEIVEAFHEISERSDPKQNQLLAQASVNLFKENPEIWELTVEIGQETPEVIPAIAERVASKIEDEHLDDFLALLQIGLESEVPMDRSHALHFIHEKFSSHTEELVDFTIFLDHQDDLTPNHFVENVSEANPEYLPALFEQVKESNEPFRNLFSLTFAARPMPDELIDMCIQHSEDVDEPFLREVLIKALGELFDDPGTHRATLVDLFEFFDERYSDEPFVRALDREKLNLDDPDAYNETKVIAEMKDYLFLLQSDRSFDRNLLATLDRYESLSDHFRDRVETKLEREDYYPLFYLLRDDRPELQFLEEYWRDIPESKRYALLSTAGFSDFLSEIKFIVAIGENGVEYDVEVPLHHHESGDIIGDVDLVVDGCYIDLLRPETWKPLSLSNQPKFIPNNAERKILNKFKGKFLGAREMTEQPCFIALDLERTEIESIQVEEALHGSLQIQIFYDEETGEMVEERLTRDPEQRLIGEYDVLDMYLNGVIWYKTTLKDTEEGIKPDIELGVVPNPEHEDGESNIQLCEDLEELLVPST